MAIVPYKDEQSGKKEQVAHMFNKISKQYDFLNHFLSLGIDNLWRKRAVRLLKPYKPKMILDVATGTGDFAVALSKLNPEKVYAIDIAEKMLDVGRKKVKRKGSQDMILFETGDSESMRFDNNVFDAVTVAFGVRNYENLEKGLQEMFRVTKSGGKVVIIEFSQPQAFPFKQLYNFYFHKILPGIGRSLSKDEAAYSYLPASVEAFPYGSKFLQILKNTGYINTKCYPLTFGISSIYWGEKP